MSRLLTEGNRVLEVMPTKHELKTEVIFTWSRLFNLMVENESEHKTLITLLWTPGHK